MSASGMKTGFSSRRINALIAALLFLTAPSFALSGGVSAVEIAQSVPLETTLALPGVRSTQQVWLEMIDGAKTSIDLEQFYLTSKPGEALEPVLNSLRAAAKRGVKVRFLLDSKFYAQYSADPKALATVPGIELRTVDYAPGIQHSKFFIVDGASVFVGSANFDWLALSHIHEIGLRVNNSGIAAKLGSVFAKDWNDGKILPPAPAPALIGHTRPVPAPTLRAKSDLPGYDLVASPANRNPVGVSESLSAILALMDGAQRTLKIQVYQYTTKMYGGAPWNTLDSAIRRAASRGVKVQLMVDAVAMKSGGQDLTALKSVSNVEVRLVRIPEWSGGHLDYARLVHSKYLVADESSAWVGTENWSGDYFLNSRNVGIVLHDGAVASKLGQIHDRVWTSTYVSAP